MAWYATLHHNQSNENLQLKPSFCETEQNKKIKILKLRLKHRQTDEPCFSPVRTIFPSFGLFYPPLLTPTAFFSLPFS